MRVLMMQVFTQQPAHTASRYFSSNGLMPVIAVVDKSYSGSNFYFMDDSNVQFTITKPKVLTAITTSVHLPDGTYVTPGIRPLCPVSRHV